MRPEASADVHCFMTILDRCGHRTSFLFFKRGFVAPARGDPPARVCSPVGRPLGEGEGEVVFLSRSLFFFVTRVCRPCEGGRGRGGGFLLFESLVIRQGDRRDQHALRPEASADLRCF